MKHAPTEGRFSSIEREVATVLRRHGVPVDRGAVGGMVAVHAQVLALQQVKQACPLLAQDERMAMFYRLLRSSSVAVMRRRAFRLAPAEGW